MKYVLVFLIFACTKEPELTFSHYQWEDCGDGQSVNATYGIKCPEKATPHKIAKLNADSIKEEGVRIVSRSQHGLYLEGPFEPDSNPVHKIILGDKCTVVNIETEKIIEPWQKCTKLKDRQKGEKQ